MEPYIYVLVEIALPLLVITLLPITLLHFAYAIMEARRKAAIQREIEKTVEIIASEQGKVAGYDYLMSLPPEYPPAPEKPKRDVYYLEDDEWGEGSK